MRTKFVALLFLASLLCFPTGRAESQTEAQAERQDKYHYKVGLKVLEKADLDSFLSRRLNGSLGDRFGQFANMFLCRSTMDLGTGIGLFAQTKEINDLPLQPAFPSTYDPTVRELLDAIACQTDSHWVYEAKNQYVMSDKPRPEISGASVHFDFLEGAAKMPFVITPASGWKAVHKAGWIMYVPPIAPMAMDFHACGKMSAAKDSAILTSAPSAFAIDALKRARPDASSKDLSLTKVGPYDAVYFEQQLPVKGELKIHWRQWQFMVGNQLCYIISTIMKDQDAQLYPDVIKMVKSFRTEPIELTTWNK